MTQRTILDVVDDLFQGQFDGSWTTWRVVLTALFGLPMTEDQATVFRGLTGREAPPTHPARELWAIVGRRGGKSRIAALLAVWLACFRRYTLAPGERGVAMVLAADRRQARVVLGYIVALIDAVPMLSALVERRTAEGLHLGTGISIEVCTCSYRTVRGYTVVAAICDEISFWRTDDAANPDTEILNALRPAMATVPESLLVCISSPYGPRGEVWKTHREHYGQDGDVLVIQADTRTMNPTVPQAVIDRAYAEDSAVASAEFGAQFRRDIEGFVSREAIDGVVVPGRRELPPTPRVRYVAFVDPSGGSQDAMTIAIAHWDGTRAVLDAVREVRPPFSPEVVVTDFATVVHEYGLNQVHGDRYAGVWPPDEFRKHGIAYRVSERTKSIIYSELLPTVNSGRVELLDHRRLLAQLAGLERRTTRSGQDSIDHAPRAHDDLINAAAGALTEALRRRSGVTTAEILAANRRGHGTSTGRKVF